MRSIALLLGVFLGLACAQFNHPPPHGNWGGGGGGPRPSSYPKQPPPGGPPGRPSPFSALSSVLPGSGGSSGNSPASYDDPIPQIPQDSSYDSQTLPAKLPILAPNGVVEIYNRVVDDLIKRLEVDFGRKKMDPMPVVIRPTPAGPVRVPGYLQRRPFRRPGAALYRAGIPPPPPLPGMPPQPIFKNVKKNGRARSNPLPETRFPEGGRPSPVATTTVAVKVPGLAEDKPLTSFRGVGKISKGPILDEVVPETTPLSEGSAEESVKTSNSTEQADAPSSEEDDDHAGPFIRSRSDEYFPADEIEDDEENRSVIARMKQKKTKKDDTMEDDDEDEKAGAKTNVDSLAQRYQSKNTNAKVKYSGGTKGNNKAKPAKTEKVESKESSNQQKVSMETEADDDDDDEDEADMRDDMDDNVSFDAEPGTGGGGRPQGGYYPHGGPPALPAKPNAVLSGLSRMRRASDVAVSVDARSAMITARLLVGPIHVNVNESSEPKERGIKATIPELEAEMILMERHGVVFLQRFTLDRAYGQDVEISIPKLKGQSKKGKGGSKNGPPPGRPGQQGGYDLNGPPNPAAQDRFQTKMAAHISMEVVKLLRSGNLRVNLMRTAQGTMSKLKLPIQKPKTKKTKKEKKSSSNHNDDNDKSAK